MGTQIVQPIPIPLDLVDLDPLNPNEMTDGVFQSFCEAIEKQGFDEPPQIVPLDRESYEALGHEDYVANEKRFRVVGGNHRIKACRALGIDPVPCVVKDWDEEEAAIQLIARNQRTGNWNNKKFTEFVRERLQGVPSVDRWQVLGFSSEKEYLSHIVKQRKSEEIVDELEPEVQPEVAATDNLSAMLAEILAESGGTVEQCYVAFAWKKKVHLLISMNEELKEKLAPIIAELESTGRDANDFFLELLALRDEVES